MPIGPNPHREVSGSFAPGANTGLVFINQSLSFAQSDWGAIKPKAMMVAVKLGSIGVGSTIVVAYIPDSSQERVRYYAERSVGGATVRLGFGMKTEFSGGYDIAWTAYVPWVGPNHVYAWTHYGWTGSGRILQGKVIGSGGCGINAAHAGGGDFSTSGHLAAGGISNRSLFVSASAPSDLRLVYAAAWWHPTSPVTPTEAEFYDRFQLQTCPPTPPIASAGPDQVVEPATVVQLNGTGSQTFQTPLTYQWVQLSGPTITVQNPTTATPTFVAPYIDATVVLQLTVVDGTVQDSDEVSIVITPPINPVANAGPDQTVAAESLVRLNGTGSQTFQAPLTYQWTQISGPTVTITNPTSSTPTFAAPFEEGVFVFQLTVYDGPLTSTDQVTITVLPYPGSFVSKWTAQTKTLFAGSNLEAGNLDGSALTARFKGLHEINYTWDGIQRQGLNTGNRFYTLDDQKIKMIHSCEDAFTVTEPQITTLAIDLIFYAQPAGTNISPRFVLTERGIVVRYNAGSSFSNDTGFSAMAGENRFSTFVLPGTNGSTSNAMWARIFDADDNGTNLYLYSGDENEQIWKVNPATSSRSLAVNPMTGSITYIEGVYVNHEAGNGWGYAQAFGGGSYRGQVMAWNRSVEPTYAVSLFGWPTSDTDFWHMKPASDGTIWLAGANYVDEYAVLRHVTSNGTILGEVHFTDDLTGRTTPYTDRHSINDITGMVFYDDGVLVHAWDNWTTDSVYNRWYYVFDDYAFVDVTDRVTLNGQSWQVWQSEVGDDLAGGNMQIRGNRILAGHTTGWADGAIAGTISGRVIHP